MMMTMTMTTGTNESHTLVCKVSNRDYLERKHVIFELKHKGNGLLALEEPLGQAIVSLANSWNRQEAFHSIVTSYGKLVGKITGKVMISCDLHQPNLLAISSHRTTSQHVDQSSSSS